MSSWPLVRLGDCAEIVSGSTPKTSVGDYWDGDVHWATPKDLSDLDGHLIAGTARTLTAAGLRSCAASVLPAGSVLFSSRAPIGLVAVNTVPMATNQGFKSFIPRPDLLHTGYLAHWLRTNRKRLDGLGNGATFKEVSKAVVARVEIPLPPVPEQRRIAEVLDRADALRAKRLNTDVILNSVIPSTFSEMFGDASTNSRGWPRRPLATLIAPGDRLNYGVVQPGENTSGGVPFVRVGDLINGRVDRSSIKYIDSQVEAAYARSRLRGVEILVSCVGTIGRVALAGPEDSGSNIARAIARVRLGPDAEREYIAAYLRQPVVQRYFISELRTVTQPTLNIKQIAATPILLPPLELQRKFSELVRAHSSMQDVSAARGERLDVLVKSLQQRAFAGQL